MAVLTTAAFISKWEAIFADNSSRAISEEDMRDFKDDIADSFQSVVGATTISSWKDPCVVATTANITLSGEQTIDGVLTSDSRVLVKNQSSTDENGIYVSAAGAWSRATDSDSAVELEGAAVGVSQGTVNKNTVWLQTTDSITLETSAINWQQVGYGSTFDVIDEDDMSSDSDTHVPTQQSVKAYVDAQVAGSGSSGTWTPTLTNVANIDSSSAPNLGMYFRIGNVVSCAVWVTVDPTTIGVTTSLGVSLPIASNFANASEAVGSGSTGEREAITVIGDPTNNRVQAGWTPSVNVTSQILIQFMYRVI